MSPTHVPDPNKADGRAGTGSNLTLVVSADMDPTYIPNPNKADGAPVAAGAPDFISYPGPPRINPPALAHIVVDANGQQWQFFNNQWS